MLGSLTSWWALGAAHRSDVPETVELAQETFRLLPQEPVDRLLDLTGVVALSRRAGGWPTPGRLAFPNPCPPEEGNPLPPEAVQALEALLTTEWPEVVAASLDSIQRAGYAVPRFLLPSLLAYASAPGRRKVLVGITSPSLAWLAATRSEWSWAVPVQAGHEAWNDETGLRRQTVLRRWRQQSPEEARAVLERDFLACGAEERALLLGALEENLSLGDEAFLESRLGDRARSVRQEAASLLSRLPGSAWSARARGRAFACLRVESSLLHRGKNLVVLLPEEECDADSERDGEGVTAASVAGGPRQKKLFQRVASVPPSCWPEHTGLDWPSLLAASQKSPHGALLRSAWVHAALIHQDTEVLSLLAINNGVFEEEHREQLAGKWDRVPGWVGAASVMLRRTADAAFLGELPAPWPEELSATVRDLVRSVVSKDPRPWPHKGTERALPQLLSLASRRAFPDTAWMDLLEMARGRSDAWWADAVSACLGLFALRGDLHKGLHVSHHAPPFFPGEIS